MEFIYRTGRRVLKIYTIIGTYASTRKLQSKPSKEYGDTISGQFTGYWFSGPSIKNGNYPPHLELAAGVSQYSDTGHHST